ncbi:MAG: GNAT family N-acetyltransferase [Actinobacteria bacterium]|nr:GNAT family N-acetyltransferase [Actinomycetota bacterium]
MTSQLTPASDREDENRRSGGLRSRRPRRNVSVALYTQPGPHLLRAWDRVVSETPGSDVTQLSGWSNLRRDAGFLPLYLLAHDDDRLVGGAVVLQRQLPVLGVVGYLPYGPVIAAQAPRAAVAQALSAELADLGHRQLSSLFVQPPEGADDISDQLLDRGFRPSTAGIAPEASIRIDLSRDLEDIRNGLTRSNRRRTHTWADHGVTVRLGRRSDLPLVADLLARTAVHQQFDPLSLNYISTLYQELAPAAHVDIFIAELGGVPVAAELFTACGGVLKSRLTGMRRSGPARKSGVSAAIVWNAIVWAKANGYHSFDFGGIAGDMVDAVRDGATSLLSGPTAFKTSFGGQPFRYPVPVELITSPLVRVGYDLARRYPAGSKFVERAKRMMRGGGNT